MILFLQQRFFSNDNDVKNTTKSVSQWLKSQKLGVLEWLTQSPYISPIDHL